MGHAPVAVLRKYIRPRGSEEHCDFCGAVVVPEHSHNFDPAARRIYCACPACAVRQQATYRQIPDAIRWLPNFQLTDAQWDELAIPISLAFFSFQTPVQRVVALYPGPAGAAESQLRLEAWKEIAEANPELSDIEPDVEALLVNRVGGRREHFVVPIDQCYKLVGIIRTHWRGLSGGALVWGEIERFFEQLRKQAALA